MKSPLLRRLSRIADSSSDGILCNQIFRRDVHDPTPANRPSSDFLVKRATVASSVPSGHVPVNVGEDMERFVVSAELLNHPVFVGFLNRSAQEYGYAQRGVLHIPCKVVVFEKVVEILRSGTGEFGGGEGGDAMSELIASLSGDDLSLWLPGTTE